MKKDEEDMDEDERLLASEEGKKLSSKERRQLRNKVSARAFRSRRKEYIGQLESEVAGKANENADLRRKLNAVEAENKSLKELTRMLLASPQFSSFLDQMNPLSTGNLSSFTSNSNQPAMQDNITVHRASIPQVQIHQAPPQVMDFQVHKDVNPARSQQGVEDWPLAYASSGSWGVGSSAVYAAEIPEIIVDANELVGKNIIDSDIFAPADGFRPGSFKPLASEKEELDYSNSYDSNGQFIYDVFEDELEDVPDYLYSHMSVHAPLSAEKAVEESTPEDALPALGLQQLFSDIENNFFPASSEPTESPSALASVPVNCHDSELARTLKSIETTYKKIGALCGL
jgi:bZIP-type transcription factor MBZ1